MFEPIKSWLTRLSLSKAQANTAPELKGTSTRKGLKPIDGGKYQPSLDLLSTCVHCGLCLNHCPTYKTLGMEMDSPRGRIYQVLQVNEGAMDFNASFTEHIDRCLGCLACEIACPSGVKYGRIVERARAQIESNAHRPFFSRLVRNLFYRHIISNFTVLKIVATLMRFYQRSGLQTLVAQEWTAQADGYGGRGKPVTAD